MSIRDLIISYPDFRLNEIIEPDQFDINNSEIVTKINEISAIINRITESVEDGGSGADDISLTSIAPFTSTKLQAFLEEVLTRLRSTVDGVSGADFIASTQITGVTGTTVQAQLESLKSILDVLTQRVQNDENALGIHKTSTDHDGRYYTETEIDTKVSGLQGQITSDVQALATHKNSTDHDTRYYTETEVDDKVGNLQSQITSNVQTIINHKTSSDHDNRYYTEQEVDTKLGSFVLKTDMLFGNYVSVSNQSWIAEEGQTVFNLTNGRTYPFNKNAIFITVDGIPQPFDAFTQNSNTRFTLSEPVPGGTKVYAYWFNNFTSSIVVDESRLVDIEYSVNELAGEGRTTETVKSVADALSAHSSESASKHIAESGSNVNGSYIRFDDGTQICRTTLTLNKDNDYRLIGGWTYPSSYIDTPIIIATQKYNGESYLDWSNKKVIKYRDTSTINTLLYVVSWEQGVPDGATAETTAIAIGRWK